MIRYKKIIITLVALIALTTGAWAESKPIGLNVEYAAGDEITSTTDVYVYYGEQPGTLKKMGVKITSTQPLKIFMIHAHGFELNGDAAVYYLPDGDATGGYAGGISCVGESTGDATVVHVASGSGTLTDPYVFGSGPSGTPVDVAWDKAKKTGTFTMPGGNVTLEPEYYPQAKWDVVENVEQLPAALEGIIAGQDAAIVTAGQSAQGTVMYAVTTSAEAAPALTAFSATVPTAKDYDDAATLYVWYYIQGQDTPDGQQATEENTFNDTEICTTPLTVQVLSNKFDIALKAANANTIEAGKATVTVGGTAATVTDGKLQGVKIGSEVKVKANTGYKFRKVEVKKAGGDTGKSLAEATVGMIVGSNGKAYAADDKDNLPEGVTAVAKVCYVDGTGHGLALALADEGEMNWSTAQTTCAAHTPAITGGTWKLATKDEWSNMITAAGSHTALRDGFSSVGGTNMQSDFYWSSTTISYGAWYYTFDGGSWSNGGKGATQYVRACLAF